MNIVIRADASLSIGTGHIVRCLNLAKKLKKCGASCTFIGREHPGNLNSRIKQAGFDVISIGEQTSTSQQYIKDEKNWLGSSQTEDAQLFVAALNARHCIPDQIIIDHYAIDEVWETYVNRAFPDARIVVIDDLCNRQHLCSLLIDQTFNRKGWEYAGRVPANCLLLTGSTFSLLKDAFYQLRELSLARKKMISIPDSLLITMGGVDINNITGKVLGYIEDEISSSLKKITVVMGGNCPHIETVKEQAQRSGLNIEVLIDVDNMPELMLEHDIAVGALGGTTWERCAMGLPAINLAIANNQSTILANLATAGAIVLTQDELNERTFISCWNKLISEYQSNVILASQICDGQGMLRIAQKIMIISDAEGRNITLRPANEDDIGFVYQLQCEPQTRRFARNKTIPTFAEHTKWMRNKLVSVNGFYYIIEAQESVGVIRLDPAIHSDAEFELSIFLTASQSGKGVAAAAITRLIQLHPNINILAVVLPDNLASHKLFQKLNFRQAATGEYIYGKNNE